MSADTLAARVTAALAADEPDAARQACLSALSRSPKDMNVYRQLGRALEAAGRTKDAAECHLGRLPASLEAEFWPDTRYNDGASHGVRVVAGHPGGHLPARSESARAEPPLARTAAAGIRTAPTETCVIEKGSVWHDGFNTVPFDRDGRAVARALTGNAGPVHSASRETPATAVDGDLVVLGARGSNNYFHWMTDILPKLAVLERCGIDWRDATFVVQNVTQRFQVETLERLGLRRDRVHETLARGPYLRADRVIVPKLDNTMCVTMGPWVSSFLRERFGIAPAAGRGARFLVSRDPKVSHGRGLRNVTEIETFYVARGYEPVIPDRHSVAEQAALFASATHVAGPHGAGLTNLHFCAPGTRVFEFYGDHLAPCYWALSEINGLDYRVCRGESCYDFSDDPLNAARTVDARRSRGFTVQLETLERLHRAAA